MDTKPCLSPALCRDLAEHNPWGRLDVTGEDVQSWFDLIWPSFSAYDYTARGTRKAVASWWIRAKEEELERARERSRRIIEERELQRMDELQQAANNVVALTPKRSFARRVVR